jgi:DNA modification methylase
MRSSSSAVPLKFGRVAVEYRRCADLKPNPHNPRTHSKRQLRKIAQSIERFGFLGVILIDRDSMVVAGHGRLIGATMVGLPEVPTICVEGLSQDEIRAFLMADNRLAIESGWSEELLRVEFQHLILNTDIDIELTGFEVAEADLIIGGEQTSKDSDDELPAEVAETITSPGDLWQLRRHRIHCADARGDYGQLMQGEQAKIVFSDPPYNCQVDGYAIGKGRIHHPEFAMASGEMSEAEFAEFLTVVFSRLSSSSSNGSVHFIAMDWRHMREILSAGHRVYDKLLNLCVWVKDNGGMGSLYRSAQELFFVFKHGRGAHQNNVQLGRFSRNRTNVWRYPGVNTASRSSEEGNLLALHPTVKPVALVADALLDCSARGDIVLDAFLGSGTTLLAAERTGRVCYGMEIEPHYVDVAIRRWQRITGEDAIHAASGRSFNDLAAEVSHA